MSQFFVLGIGGTGMRCIESLLHLCAMGMFDATGLPPLSRCRPLPGGCPPAG